MNEKIINLNKEKYKEPSHTTIQRKERKDKMYYK